MLNPKKQPALRRMRKAKPPRALMRQQMSDEKRRISMHIGNFLVLLEEGTPEQAALAKQKARSELLKIGPELEKLAGDMGEKYSLLIRDFLDSIDGILYSAAGWIDAAKITNYFSAEQKLEKAITKE